jgi:hypothetical protein
MKVRDVLKLIESDGWYKWRKREATLNLSIRKSWAVSPLRGIPLRKWIRELSTAFSSRQV